MMCLTIRGNIEPILPKKDLTDYLHANATEQITNIIVSYQLVYIKYFGALPVKLCRILIQNSLNEYGVPKKYHNEVSKNIFSILQKQYDVKYRKVNTKFDESLIEEIKNSNIPIF